MRAHCHAVQRCVVGILAGHGYALHAFGRQGCHHTTGHAVVGGHHRVYLAAIFGQDLLHVLLRYFRFPAVGELVADDLDVALLDGGVQHLLLTVAQELGIGVGRRALDHGVVAFRLGCQHSACLHAADLLVVERDVGHTGRFYQAVIGDDGNLLLVGLVHGRQNGVFVHRKHDQYLGTLGNQAIDVGQLLLGRTTRVGADVLGARLCQLCLDGGLVGLPALLLEIGPAYADGCLRESGGAAQCQSEGRKTTFELHACLQ